MSYNAKEFLLTVVRPALAAIGRPGIAAEQLLMGTAVKESDLLHKTQLGGGPALGYFQMEPATHEDLWSNFLSLGSGRELGGKIRALGNTGSTGVPASSLLKDNDQYAAAMCRAHYARRSDPLPAANDVEAMAAYWKKWYNTPLGAGTADQFVVKWQEFKLGDLPYGG